MPNDVLSAALQRLAAGRDLEENEARDVLLEIMGGRAGEAQTAAFLSAPRVKGETAALPSISRKVRSRSRPTAVSTLSGWNCTPCTGSSRWRTPITMPSAFQAPRAS